MAATLQMLEDARNAYHRLMLGENVVRIRDSDGKEMQYTAAIATRLAAYITKLEIELGVNRPLAGPMRVWY